MTLSDRLKRIASFYNLTVRDFERRAGLANGYVRTIGNSMGSNKVESILTAFPDVSRVWLLTGEGEMINNSCPEEKNNPVEVISEDPALSPGVGMAKRLLALVESQQKTIAEQAATISRQAATIEKLADISKKEVGEEAPGILAPADVVLR